MKRFASISTAFTVVTLSLFSATATAQAPKPGTPAAPAATATAVKTPTQAYAAYIAALKKATKVEEVLPLLIADIRGQVNATPAPERPQFFGLIKMMTLEMHTGVKVLKETIDGSKAVLDVEGLNPGGKKTTGTIKLEKEGGAWKVGVETWK